MTGDLSQNDLDSLTAELACDAKLFSQPKVLAAGKIQAQVTPRDRDSLTRLLKRLSDRSLPVLVTGGGTQLHIGNPIRNSRLMLSCLAISGIDELDLEDGVIQVAAGTPLEEVRNAVASEGWFLPIEPPSNKSTVGGVLATALLGPRQLGFGHPRDAVLGMETVLASGQRVKCGARVVKNVSGYDMAKLYVGSLGTLAVIERVWLRLRPSPIAVSVVEAALSVGENAFTLAREIARRSTSRSVFLTLAGDSGEPITTAAAGSLYSPIRLRVEFAGDESAVKRDETWLGERCALHACDPETIDPLGSSPMRETSRGIRFRLHVRQEDLAAATLGLREHDAELLVYPVPGVVYAQFEPENGVGEDQGWFDWVFSLLDSHRSQYRAECFVEFIPLWAAGKRDVFVGTRGLSLMRALKQRFDPSGILNPGRFAGSI